MTERLILREWLGKDDGQIALVLTDVIGSTRLALSKGDDSWVQALKCHFARARDLKANHHGYEVKLIGDACMMAFRTAWPALQFALEFDRFTGHDDIRIRGAVHVGEISIVENDIYGVMINYTSRLLKAAPSGPIIVSDKAMQNVRNKLGADFKEHMLARGPFRLPEILGEFRPSEQEVWRVSPVPRALREARW